MLTQEDRDKLFGVRTEIKAINFDENGIYITIEAMMLLI